MNVILLVIMKKSLKKMRKKARVLYKKIGEIYCPYLKENVAFTSEGFNHLRYRGLKERHCKVQETRYKLLHLAPEIIIKSGTLQEFETKNNIKFFGFIAIIRGWKAKVIIRQVGNGKKHFWSIIPNWKTRVSKEGKNIYKNHTGDLTKD